MNKTLDQAPKRVRLAPRVRYARALLLAGGATFVLAACNSLTGVGDLNVIPGTVNPGGGTGGAVAAGGTGGTGATGGVGANGGNGGTDITGNGGSTMSGGDLGTPCSDSTQCKEGLSCAYGICRTTCTSDADAACAQTACLTDFGAGKGSGCRVASEACPNGAGVGDLLCGPDKILRMPCDPVALTGCRMDQVCVSGTCIGTLETGTTWGKCGKQGKSCANTDLTVCDVGVPGKHTDKCTSKAICDASVPGDAQTCVACSSSEKKCTVDATSHHVSGVLCNNGQTGFDPTDCTTTDKKPQCNPSLGICQKIAVDANEVTQLDYKKFLTDKTGDTGKLGNDNPAVPAACVDNDLKPDATCYANAAGTTSACPLGNPECEKHPQVCVDWCDAFAYCASYGKKLCGKIGGGLNDNLPLADFNNPGASEWMNACTSAGRFVYATDIDDNYTSNGPDTIGQQCNGKDKGQVGDPNKRLTLPVDDTKLLNCKHQTLGYETVRNLLGNAREWESSCAAPATSPTAKRTDACRVRGGSFRTNDDDDAKTPLTSVAMRCDYAETELRGNVYPDVGFRCCDL